MTEQMSVSLKDLRKLPFNVRPDRVLVYFPAFSTEDAAFSIFPDLNFELVDPNFDPDTIDLDGEMFIAFEYFAEPGEDENDSTIVYHRQSDGAILVDELEAIFNTTAASELDAISLMELV